PSATPSLQIRDVSRSFGGLRAVSDVSLHVQPGEIVGVIGANGAGKTSLLDACSGFLRPDAGTISLDGVDVTGLSPSGRAARGLGRVFQDARRFPSLTVSETLALSFERHLDVRDPVACTLRIG